MFERTSPWILLGYAFLLLFVIYPTRAVWPLFVGDRGFREGAFGLILGLYGLALFTARSPIGFLRGLLVGRRCIVVSAGFPCLVPAHPMPAVSDLTWSRALSRVLIGPGDTVSWVKAVPS